MKVWLTGLTALALIGGALAVGVAAQDNGRLASGLSVAGVDVSGLTRDQALQALAPRAVPASVQVSAGKNVWTLSADKLGWQADLPASVAAAEKVTSERKFLERLQALLGQVQPQQFPLVSRVDAAQAKATLSSLTQPLQVQPRNASIYFDAASKRYAVKADVVGRGFDLETPVNAFVSDPSLTALSIPVQEWKAQYTAATLSPLAAQGNALMRPFTATLQGTTRTGVISPLQVANLYWVKESGIVADEKALQAAFQNLTSQVDQPAQNARYVIQGTTLLRIKEKPGTVTDRPLAFAAFREAVLNVEKKSVQFASKPSLPTLTIAQLPDAGKLQLIAVGNSTYYHSTPERRANVANAARKINGAVIASGEVFSFLRTVGGVNARNGFVGGLIISNGRTVDGLGGGVCQVSTTTFRALYQAGLPVVERNQHSYRVGYYEPFVGFEAAVYDPGVDLKFRNDTGAPILIRTVNNNASSRLQVQVWGVKPNRSVYISPAVILSRTPHPPAQYVVNPKLSPGTVKQVDWAADGYNLYITRTIRDTSGSRTDVTRTMYKPWRAVYEVGPGARLPAGAARQ